MAERTLGERVRALEVHVDDLRAEEQKTRRRLHRVERTETAVRALVEAIPQLAEQAAESAVRKARARAWSIGWRGLTGAAAGGAALATIVDRVFG